MLFMNALWILAVALVVLGGLGGYVYVGLSHIDVESFPSILSVTVSSITYDLVLNHTQNILGQGSFDSFALPAGDITEVEFTQSVNWVPSASLALELLSEDKIYMVIEGTATIDILGIYTHEAPIVVAVDIKNLLLSQARAQGLGLL